MNGGESKPKDRKRLARAVKAARKVRHLWSDKAIDEGWSPFPMEVWAIVRVHEEITWGRGWRRWHRGRVWRRYLREMTCPSSGETLFYNTWEAE